MSTKTYLYEKIKLVRSVTDAEIREMLAVMRPVVQAGMNQWRMVDVSGVHPRDVSYIWNPKPYGPALTPDQLDSGRIMSFHNFGAPSLFKPSLAEVLGAIRTFVPEWSRVRYFGLDAETAKPFGMVHAVECLVVAKMLVPVTAGGEMTQLIPFDLEEYERCQSKQ